MNTILDWSEVWALLIPLAFIIFYKPDRALFRPLVIYVCIAIILTGISTTSFYFNSSMPSFLKNNNIFYNLHSIVRVVFFTWFFYKTLQKQLLPVTRIVFAAYLVFILVNFTFFENPFFFSTRVFAAESIVLLFICISFLLRSIQDETINFTKQPSFLVCAGLVIYEAITFFIFLFILPLATKDPQFGLISLKIYKMAFVLLCCLMAVAFLKNKRPGKQFNVS